MGTLSQHNEPVAYVYDGTFEGFLSTVFRAFEIRREPLAITRKASWQPTIFGNHVEVETVAEQCDRVWNGIVKRSTLRNAQTLHLAYQSELPDIELRLWRYLKALFTSSSSAHYRNTLNEHVHDILKIARKVYGETHRMLGFVRFQQAADGTYFAAIAPDHNILWLMQDHFRSRLADQQWIIYDTRRHYGLFYNLQEVTEIRLEPENVNLGNGKLASEVRDADEDYYRNLWQAYYKAINIKERKNTRQMMRLMPHRYWKYLPEKDDLSEG